MKKLALRSQNVDVRDAIARPADRSAERVLLDDRWVVDDGAEGTEADVGGAVSQQQRNEREA